MKTRNLILFFTFLLFTTQLSVSQTKVKYPESFTNGWEKWIGSYVEFDQPLYLCSRGSNNVVVAYKPLVTADETATFNSEQYTTQRAANNAAKITLTGLLSHQYYTRLGNAAYGIKGTITQAGAVSISNADANKITWGGNPRPSRRPEVGNARLIVCATNVENLFPQWSGTSGAQSDAEYLKQMTKIVKGLINIDADLYGMIELQEGSIALDSLIERLNKATATGRYDYVKDNNTTNGIYTKVGYIYRTDKLTPIGTLGIPYPNSKAYCKRQYVQMFEENATGERFVYSLNHFKAKSGGDPATTNATRMKNVTQLTNFLETNPYPDTDILIMGDLNCYFEEEPLRHLVSKGYENQLLKYAPDGYSYWYKGEKGHLDQAFSSPSMSSQITGAAAYAINATESTYYSYRNNNEPTPSMYRYADHDPIIVGLSLNIASNPTCEDINFTAPLTTGSFNEMSAINTIGEKSWYLNGNYGATMTGYSSTTNEEDWLISPTFNLSGKSNAVLTFDHALNKGNVANKTTAQTLWVSTNYISGNPNNATWEQLIIPQYPLGTNWSFVNSGNINLPSYLSAENVHFAFKYTSLNTTEAEMWEIKNISFKAQCETQSDKTILSDNNAPWYYTNGNTLYVNLTHCAPLKVTTLMGQTIYQGYDKVVSLPQTGCYIIQADQKSAKIMIP